MNRTTTAATILSGSPRLALAAVFAGLVFATSGPAWAVNQYWDINGAAPGAGGATPSGPWDTTTTNWSIDATGTSATTTWSDAANDFANFSAGTDATGSYTVTLDNNRQAAGLYFQDGSPTLVGNGTDRAISLTGAGGVIVGAGAGAVNIGSTTPGQGVPIGIAQGAHQTWVNNSAAPLNVYNNVSMAAGIFTTLTLDGTNTGNNTIAGNFSSAGFLNIVKNGTGTWVLSGTSDNAPAFINEGTLIASAAAGASLNSVTVGDNVGAVNSAVLKYGANNQVGNAITVSADGQVDFNGRDQTIPNVGGNGFFMNGGSVVNSSVTIPTLKLGGNNNTGIRALRPGTTSSVAGINVDLNGAATAQFNTSGDLTISANIVNSTLTGGITDNGSGTLTLSGNNSYNGNTVLTGGAGPKLNINSNTALGNGTGSFQINGVATIDNTSGSPVTLTNNNPITVAANFTYGGTNNLNLGTGAVTMSVSPVITTNGSATLTIGGAINSSANTLTKAGPGNLTLSGANLYSGATTIQGGTLQVGNGTTGSLNGATGTALTFNTYGGKAIFNEAAGATQNMGTLTFTAGENTVQSTYGGSGTTTLTFGSLAGPRSAGATGNFVSSGGTNGTNTFINLTGQAAGFIDQGYFFGGSNYAWMDNAGTFVRGINYGVDGSTFTSAGGTAISSANGIHQQITGAVTAQTTDAFSTLNISGNNNFTLDAAQTVTVNGILKSGNTAGGATISGGSGIQAASAADLVIRTDGVNDAVNISSQILDNGTSSLTKSGAGSLTLSAANAYAGTTRVLGGTLTYGINDAIAGGGITVNGPSAVVDIGTFSDTVGAVTMTNGTITGSTGVLAPASLTVDTGTVSALINSAGTLTKNGTGTATLTRANTFGGGATLSSGALNIGNANAIGSGAFTINGGTLDNTSGGAISLPSSSVALGGNFAFSGTNALDLGTGAVTVSSNRNITVNGSGALTIGGNIAATGSNMIKSGLGTLVLNGTNNHSGTNTISAGTLSINNIANTTTPQPLGVGTGNLIIGSANNTATLKFTGTNANYSSNFNIQIVNGGSTSLAHSVIEVTSPTTTLTLTGVVGQTAAGQQSQTLSKTGPGTLELTGNNTFINILAIKEGTISVPTVNNANANGPLGGSPAQSPAVQMGSFGGGTGTLKYTGAASTSSSKAFAMVNGGIGAFQIDNPAAALTLSAAITGTGGVAKTGPGTLVLTGANTFAGQLLIKAGTLQTGTFNDVGVLGPLGNSLVTAPAIVMGDTGGVTGTLQYTGASAIRGKSFSMASGGTGAFDITLGGTTLTLRDQFTGSGSLAKIGAGTMVLTSKESNWSGTTAINAGTFLMDGIHTGGGLYTVGDGSGIDTLGGNGSIGANISVSASGGVLSPGSSIGTLSLINGGDVTLLGKLLIEVDGTGSGSVDLLNTVDALTIGAGTVDFSVLSVLDDPAYVFAKYNTLSGTFASVLNLPAGYQIDYNYQGGNQIALTVPVPEPTSLALAAFAAAGMVLMSRRRRVRK